MFEEGKSFTLAKRPNSDPDFIVLTQVSYECKIEGLYLANSDLKPVFILLSSGTTADCAANYFDALTLFPDTTLTELALPLRKNQVWGVKTRKNYYAKILIMDVWADADTS